MADLSKDEVQTFREILSGVARRSRVATAVICRDQGPSIYYKDGLIWTSWARKYPIEDARGWVAWSIKEGQWEPYRPKAPEIIDLSRPGEH